MSVVARYEQGEAIFRSATSFVCRGRRREDGRPVILKVLEGGVGSLEEMRYRQEFSIVRSLALDGVVRAYDLCVESGETVLVLEDFGGVPLHEALLTGTVPLERFLDVASTITRAVAELHAQDVIHKDLNPSNILLNPETGELKLIDFGISTRLSRERRDPVAPESLEGSLAYMAPEQTGRINSSLDHRADIYALGVTFYQLLSGRLPFEASDALAMVHHHLATRPTPLHEVDAAIPRPISSLVARMLHKRKEERYQSAAGILADLQRCRGQLREHGQITEFALGADDVPSTFEVPARLYGRADEKARILSLFDRVCRGAVEMLWIGGYSGVGKTALVQELHVHLTRGRGVLISGKFDQLQRSVPLSGLAQALRELALMLLTEPPERVESWRARLSEALGHDAGVVTELVPELALLLGPQPTPPALSPSDTLTRSNNAMLRLLRALCAAEHPLVLFLDDLQWIDAASLALLEHCLQDDRLSHLLLIGAYRDNEVSATHPLMLSRSRLASADVSMTSLMVRPLDEEAITELLRDVLPHSDASAFAPVLLQKSGGNPFFIRQFLLSLYDDGTIRREGSSWRVDVDGARGRGVTENVVDIVLGALARLPVATQDALHLAACLGHSFDLSTLALIGARSLSDSFDALEPAIGAELIFATSGLRVLPGTEPARLIVDDYRFAHDRIQQAAYELREPALREAVHLEVGQRLEASLGGEEREQRLFEIVDHLNRGAGGLRGLPRRLQLAELNLQAGRRALAAAAPEAAQSYLAMGRDMLPEDAWETCLELCLELHREGATAEYSCANYDQVDALIDRAISHVDDEVDVASLLRVRIAMYTLRGRHQRAMEIGVDALALFDIHVPPLEDVEAAIGAELGALTQLLHGRPIAQLIDDPVLTDPHQLRAQELLIALNATAYLVDLNLNALLTLKSVNLALRHGLSGYGAVAFSCYGAILCPVFNQAQVGFEFCELALAISERFQDDFRKAEICLVFQAFGRHWVRPLGESQALAEEGYRAALESGHQQYQGYNLLFATWNGLIQGHALPAVVGRCQDYMELSVHTDNLQAVDGFLGCLLACQNMRGQTSAPQSFDGETIDEASFITQCHEHHSFVALGNFLVFKAFALLVHGAHAAALDAVRAAGEVIPRLGGAAILADFHCVRALLHCSPGEAPADSDAAVTALEELRRWGASAPENWASRIRLVEAELHRVRGEVDLAMDGYDDAIDRARAAGTTHIRALAAELAASFWSARGKERFARAYEQEASRAWRRWGAAPWAARGPAKEHSTTSSVSLIDSSGPVPDLDAATIVKAVQLLSSKTEVHELGRSLLEVAIENAGADLGALILCHDDDHREVLGSDGTTTSLEERTELAMSALRVTMATGEAVLVDDALHDPVYGRDSSVVNRGVRSLACLPVTREQKLLAVLYLENRSLPRSFNTGRVGLLEAITAQAAISLESARLFDALRRREAQWRSLVDDAPDLIALVDEAHKLRFINRGVPGGVKTVEGLVLPEHRHEVWSCVERALVQQEVASFSAQLSAAGQPWVRARVGPVLAAGESPRAIVVASDVTIERDLEHQLRHAQKMEAIGTLAGGVAHDFNNLLTVIQGSAELALMHVDDGSAAIPLIEDVGATATRAASLTRQLLAFSRKQILEPRVLDLNGLVADLIRMLSRLVGEDVHIVVDLADVALWTKVDPGQFEQVLLNLVVNARDAMPGGGTVHVTTRPEGTRQEDGVVMTVRDGGVGIEPEVLEQIFEPFFTTKEVGSGTGLGLSTVHGIVKQSGGRIEVDSTVGEGTSFHVWLPGASGSDAPVGLDMSVGPPRGTETVLVLEDDDKVRSVIGEMLESLGYVVVPAGNRAEAIEAIEGTRRVDLLLTDVVIAESSGPEVARVLLARCPELRVLYVSGYSGDASSRGGSPGVQHKLLQKPFSRETLALRLREVLDAE